MSNLRQQEVKSIAAALYAEIITLRTQAAQMAKFVAKRYEDHGLGRYRGEPFDAHFFETVPMPAPSIYPALAAQIGKLPAEILLGIVQFYSAYEESRYWLPMLEDKEDRATSYSVLWVLHPALNAIEGVQSTLRKIETLAVITPAAEVPDVKRAKTVINWEEEQWSEIREQSE